MRVWDRKVCVCVMSVCTCNFVGLWELGWGQYGTRVIEWYFLGDSGGPIVLRRKVDKKILCVIGFPVLGFYSGKEHRSMCEEGNKTAKHDSIAVLVPAYSDFICKSVADNDTPN